MPPDECLIQLLQDELFEELPRREDAFEGFPDDVSRLIFPEEVVNLNAPKEGSRELEDVVVQTASEFFDPESIIEMDFDSYESIDLDQLFEHNFEIFSNEDLPKQDPQNDPNLINLFPHIRDEKNRRRRSLLYERSYSPKNSSSKKESKSYYPRPYNRKLDPLLNHDYTQRKNDEDKYFPCPERSCEKVYAKASHLKAHLRRHSGEKPFVCNWQNCTWKFSRSDELARHKRSHSGVKPYKCELCEKAFARSDHLAKHLKVHRKKMAQFGDYFIKRKAVKS